MTDLRTYLCVGGPLAGKRKDTEHDTFQVMRREPLALTIEDTDISATVPMVERITYRSEVVGFPGGTISFFVPQAQPFAVTIAMLLEAYQRDATISQPQGA